MCRRSKSATGLGDTPLESLPLLHQAPTPTPEPKPALQQEKDSDKDSNSIATASEQDNDSVTKSSVGALVAHADEVAIDTPGTQASTIVLACVD